MIMERPSNNGGKTRPLSDHAREVLQTLPRPCYEINAGVVDRLTRGGLAVVVGLTSPHGAWRGTRNFLHITPEGAKEARKS